MNVKTEPSVFTQKLNVQNFACVDLDSPPAKKVKIEFMAPAEKKPVNYGVVDLVSDDEDGAPAPSAPPSLASNLIPEGTDANPEMDVVSDEDVFDHGQGLDEPEA